MPRFYAMTKPMQQNVRNGAAILISAATLSFGVFSLIQSVGSIGKPFSGFFFGPNLLVSITQRAPWPGMQAGLKSLEKIKEVDGVSYQNGWQLLEKVDKAKIGDTLNYTIENHDGGTYKVRIPVVSHTLNDFLIGFLAPFLMGLLFLFFGVILYFAQPEAPAAFVYLLLSCIISSFCMTVYEAYTSFLF